MGSISGASRPASAADGPTASRILAPRDDSRALRPKERVICAAPFRDRVVHQAIVQVVEPLFEPGFIFDSYACRKGKGTHAAVDRVAAWARRYRWALKLDVQKYFPSIDHEIARQRLARRLDCARTLDLFARILASWQSDEAPRRWFAGDDLFTPLRRKRGLPIGNLTSQFLANVVLDAVDHAVKDEFGARAYARYCDDLVVLGDDVVLLRAAREVIDAELAALRLSCHPHKTHLFPVAQGIPWLGFLVCDDRVDLRPAAVSALRRRRRAFDHRLRRDRASRTTVVASVAAASGCRLRSTLTGAILLRRRRRRRASAR